MPFSLPLVASDIPQLVDGDLPVSASLCMHFCVPISPFYRDNSHLGLGAILVTSS